MPVALIIDFVIVIVILISVFLSARHGFVRTLLEVAGFIAAFLIASAISPSLANMTYDNIIGPSIVSKVTEASEDANANISSGIWDSLPEIVKNNPDKFGISKSAFEDTIDSYTDIGSGDHAENISQNVVKPVIVKLISAIYSIITAIVLIILSKFLAKVINKLFTFSVIGKINASLGGVVGAVKGVAIVFILCMIISILVVTTNNEFYVFTPENIEKTYLFKIFYGFSPFA